MIWVLLFCQLAWIHPGQGLYHEPSAFWIEPPRPVQPESYFGYSVTYEPQSKQIASQEIMSYHHGFYIPSLEAQACRLRNSGRLMKFGFSTRLIASAPRQDNIGKVYHCDIDKNSCVEVLHNISRQEGYDHNYWLGAVVKAGQGFFVTCAPLYVERQPYTNSSIHYMGTFSHCYNYTELTAYPTQLSAISKDTKAVHTTKFEQTMDSFGWSIDIDSKNDVIIGGPAMFTGRAIKYDGLNPLDMTGIASHIEYNFGYSVVAGKFREWGNTYPTYAIGSPYGYAGRGRVALYNQRPKDKKMTLIGTLKNDQDEHIVGSMFGAVLCAAELYSRRRTALVVGAPTYSPKQTYSQGAVFIYEPGQLPRMPLLTKIEGKVSGSYFGSAIVSVGDLNGDSMDEIAIAAPYERYGSGANMGVVYIYSSVAIKGGVTNIEPLQRIVAEAQSFGLSVTPLQNHDGKGCNELAIGAPQSNKVKVFKCIPTLVVELSPLEIIDEVEASLQVITSFCLHVTYPKGLKDVEKTLIVKVNIEHPDVVLTNKEDGKQECVIPPPKTKEPICKKIALTKPLGGNYDRPIKYNLTVVKDDDVMKQKELKEDHVILSDRSKLVLTGPIYLSKCKNKSNCVPDLKYLNTTWTLDKDSTITPPYVIGSSKEILVEISLRNDGEVAYDSCIRVTVVGTTISRPSTRCERQSTNELNCAPMEALVTDKTWSTHKISLRADQLISTDKKIELNIRLFNKCTEKVMAVNKLVSMDLKADFSTVSIKGITDLGKDDMVNLTQARIDAGNVVFNQNYMIRNSGPAWDNLTATVIVQKKDYIEIEKGVIVRAELDSPKQCEKVGDDSNKWTYTCSIARISKDELVTVTIQMFVKTGDLESIIKAEDNNVHSTLDLQVEGTDLKQSCPITSILRLDEAKVAWWIILVAVLMGLLVLIVFIFIMREVGFFQRNKKEQLKTVERSVKRQTILRRSMMERCPPAPDQHKLVEDEAGEAAVAVNVKPRPDTRVRVFPE